MLAINGGTPTRTEKISYGKQYIDENDVKAVTAALTSSHLTTGPAIKNFEKKLCELTGARYTVTVSNGTAALHAACFAAGIKSGDEVITTPITFAASANCILYCGGIPVFADINPYTWNIDPNEIEKKITEKTKAVIAVDFTGQVAQLNEIREICKKHKLTLIEDAAHSIGSKYNNKPVGGIADLTTFSFHPVKTITCGEGGAILTNDEGLNKILEIFRTHGITRDPNIMSKEPFIGYMEQVELGYNYRLTDIQAALGVSQLAKLDKFSTRRREIVSKYNEAFKQLPQIILQETIPESYTVPHLYVVRLNLKKLTVGRGIIMKALDAENIGVQVHYIPVYYHPYYQKLGYSIGQCPIAEELYESIFSIPLYYALTDVDVASVIQSVRKVVEYYSK